MHKANSAYSSPLLALLHNSHFDVYVSGTFSTKTFLDAIQIQRCPAGQIYKGARGNPDGPVQAGDREQTQIPNVEKSKDRSGNWRYSSQQNDTLRAPRVRDGFMTPKFMELGKL
ncbi:hypothetical protein [Pseudovibrio axinellae]|uniref:hypothetical protein n=1 Tax=Pseudovibrio axinellae TaxID=989403 RepID=UPI0012908A2E|nr:hypothetical protein [Pseudovibrio axinellae]